MKKKIVKTLIFSGLIIYWWYFLVSHYYEVLSAYARLKIYQSNPQMYIAVEWWLLVSLMVCTYLVIKGTEVALE